MAQKKAKTNRNKSNGGNLGFEEKLWQAADKMRGHMDPAEYKHVVLGLIFLKYISDAFEERHSQLESSAKDPSSEYYVKDPEARYGIVEDRDEYLSENIFWVPKDARWSYLQANAKQPTIGKIIDDAMVVIEKENPKLKGVLPKDYARPTLDKLTLGELIDLIGTIGLGDAESRSKDILGRVYEYFLGRFASAEGKGGGEFYTPQSVVKILVEMIEPYKGRVYDPCCGSGGMFVQSEKFVEAHGGRKNDIAVNGQELNPTTWRLCNMNLAIRGIEGNIGSHHADTFRQDIQKDLRADFILANPPFNVSDWKGELLREDVRWRYGIPPVSNANFAWVQHFIHHLSPNGIAGFVLANGSMSSNRSGEGEIRKNIIEADLVDCMIALPGQLFYTTPIPACLWFITRNKKNSRFRDRRGQTLFIDVRKMGHLIDRTHREFSDEEITRIVHTYHAWRTSSPMGEDTSKPPSPLAGEGRGEGIGYADIPGFCKSATLEEIRSHGYVLTPGRYVGAEYVADDNEPFNEKMKRLTLKLEGQFAEGTGLEKAIKANLRNLFNK
ncbi:MAG: N-6 DNA methylase [Nitrospinae bacterium RIFCSPLOWO2_02_39_17]|nr:MAG: N-6 DNA methylase [Nitrospinae bacterium RIFCSPLOWO2_02_39_17]